MLAALSFLTPLGPARVPNGRTLAWFPLVGAAIGLVLGGIWWATARAWTPGVAAALVIVADLGITGLLHFDGLVDSADGLLPHLSRGRRLSVMTEPQVGAFGIGVGGAVLLARWAALAAMRPSVLLLTGIWCLSRTSMALIARALPYARRDGGLAEAFLGRDATTWLVLPMGLVAAFALGCSWRLLPGAVSLLVGAAAAGAVAWLARRRIGGYTGDVLGAAGVLAETVALLAGAAKW